MKALQMVVDDEDRLATYSQIVGHRPVGLRWNVNFLALQDWKAGMESQNVDCSLTIDDVKGVVVGKQTVDLLGPNGSTFRYQNARPLAPQGRTSPL